MPDPEPPKVFRGNLVKVEIEQRVEAKVLDDMAAGDAQLIAQARIANYLSEFLTKHFLRTRGNKDGSIDLSLQLTLMVAKVPPGVAFTTIAFQELPKPETLLES